MEIKGKIKEISVDERQAKVVLEDGMIISSNQPVQMETVRHFSEGDNIMADVFSSPGKPGTKWEKYKFWNINSIELVIQREDEFKEPDVPVQSPEPTVEAKTTIDAPLDMPETEKERDKALPPSGREVAEALAYTPESATMEIGRLWLKLITASKEYFKAFK